MLRGPRRAYTTSFADAFSDDIDSQRSYAKGILSVACIFLVFLVVWTFVLVVLKIKGKEVGCASGMAFQLVKEEEDDSLQETDSSSGDESNGGRAHLSSRVSNTYEGRIEDQSSWDTEPERSRTKPYNSRMKEKPLERKTRMCFLFSSIISLCIVPFILVFSFGPMKEAIEASKQAVLVSLCFVVILLD